MSEKVRRLLNVLLDGEADETARSPDAVRRPAAPAEAPRDELETWDDGTRLVVSPAQPLLGRAAAAAVLALPWLFVVVAFARGVAGEPVLPLLVLGLALEALAIFVVARDRLTRRQLRIAPDYVEEVVVTPWGEQCACRLEAREIASVAVRHDPAHGCAALVVEGGDEEVRLSHGLSERALRWLEEELQDRLVGARRE